VEIHSELNETPQPGYHGTKTTLLDREPSVTQGIGRPETRKLTDRAFAEIRYEDDSGPQLFLMTQNDISVGRGGNDVQVNLALYTNDEVSREHLRLRRDPDRGLFFIIDASRNGTWVNGKRLHKGVEEFLPDQAQIGVAEVLTLIFEAKR
jgi:pSer/pThr/pTyr-binding forkhead associated (FHA) protein